jgi:hypothetical protein
MPSPANKSSAAPAKKSSPRPEAASVPAPAKAAAGKAPLTPAERMKMIAEAAYYLAEKRGFSGGNELTDWVAAEKQVDSLLAKRG